MDDIKKRFHTFHLGGSILKVPVRLDEQTGRHFLDCPDLEEFLTYTASGFLWVSAVQDSCSHHEGNQSDGETYQDCGTCRFFRTEHPGDIIGICQCEALSRNPNLNGNNMETI